MKKTIFSLAALLVVLFANISSGIAGDPVKATSATTAVTDWTKAKDGTWPGMMNGKIYWYKIDKNASLWWSTDGKKWSAVPDGMWADKDGKWLKIVDQKLVWSADMGKSWSEVPEWKWMGSDNMWYKFNKDWSVWVNK